MTERRRVIVMGLFNSTGRHRPLTSTVYGHLLKMSGWMSSAASIKERGLSQATSKTSSLIGFMHGSWVGFRGMGKKGHAAPT
jgi:hypothetical protein